MSVAVAMMTGWAAEPAAEAAEAQIATFAF